MHLNEDDGDDSSADVIWSAMIDEVIWMGIDCGKIGLEFLCAGELSTGGCQESNAISGAIDIYDAC